METAENIIEKKESHFIRIIITECVFVFTVLLAVMVIKYFFKDSFTELSKWYKENVCVTTEINEVLETESNTDEI